MFITPSSITKLLDSLVKEGAFVVVGANVINKLVLFVSNILIVNFLTKDDYGIFSYANSIYSFALLLTGLNLLSGLLIFCSEERPDDEKESIRKYVAFVGTGIDSFLALLLLIVGLFVVLPIEEAGQYLCLFAPVLVLDYIHQFFIMVLRSKRMNRTFAYLQNINSFAYAILSCLGAYLGGIAGAIFGYYLAYSISIVCDFIACRTEVKLIYHAKRLAKNLKKELWSFSLANGAAGYINQVIYIVNVIIIGILLQDAAVVATYKVATALPEGLSLIPTSALLFALPYFAAHNKDKGWFTKHTRLLFAVLAGINGLVTLVLVVFSPQLIELLWGSQYLDGVTPFRILAVGYFFSASLRIPSTNLLGCLREVKLNLIISIVSGIADIAFVFILVSQFGLNGAAFTTFAVMLIAGFLGVLCLLQAIRRMPKQDRGLDETASQ